jgi:hypothetical protein
MFDSCVCVCVCVLQVSFDTLDCDDVIRPGLPESLQQSLTESERSKPERKHNPLPPPSAYV